MRVPAPTNAPLRMGDISSLITSPAWIEWFQRLSDYYEAVPKFIDPKSPFFGQSAPANPSEGLLAYADGTNWDPDGTGRAGIYLYTSAVWSFANVTLPGTTVSSETAFGILAAVGTSLLYARADHTHGTPSLATAVVSETSFGLSATVGSGTKAAKDDHTHGSPTDPIPAHVAAADPHSVYALLVGRAGGQTLKGSTGASENLVLQSTSNATRGYVKSEDTFVLPKTSGKGIAVDTTTPTFGYRDLLGDVKILSPGANDPTVAVFRDSIRAFSFSNAVMNECFMFFHIPHDYVPGSDVFIHTHWSQNVVDSGGAAGVPGVVKWSFEVSYAKGHDQAAFPASLTTFVTQTASGTQYQHMLIEVQLSAASPSATQIDSDDLEPDGIILVRCFRNPGDAADTLNQVPFLHYVDIHYQSTNIATKAKAPNFYA
jgi:hypothetical protein